MQGVTPASMHAAKGLEWDAVFVVGSVDGVVPIAQSLSRPEAVEEERRLLYRCRPGPRATDLVVVAGSQSRGQAGSATEPLPDRHRARVLAERPGASQAGEEAEGRPGGRGRELFEWLRAWRSQVAQSASVPAYVVFTDATLQAIAETRPANLMELSSLPGIGARKLDLYGEGVLATVSGWRGPPFPHA